MFVQFSQGSLSTTAASAVFKLLIWVWWFWFIELPARQKSVNKKVFMLLYKTEEISWKYFTPINLIDANYVK